MSKEIKEVKLRPMFDVFGSIIKKDFIPNNDELKSMNSFVMCKWLSNSPSCIEVANFINNVSDNDMPINVQYWFARSVIKNVKHIPYPKKDSSIDKDIEILSDHFECNYELAKTYYKILPAEEREKIIKKYKHIGRTR